MFRKLIIVVLTLGAVGSACLWVLSLFVFVSLNTLRYGVSVDLSGDVSLAGVYGECVPAAPPPLFKSTRVTPQLRAGRWRWDSLFSRYLLPGWQSSSGGKRCQGGSFILRVPLATSFLVFAAYPALAFIRGPVRRHRRRKRGQCVGCGYNLTGNVTGVCPECGTEVRPP